MNGSANSFNLQPLIPPLNTLLFSLVLYTIIHLEGILAVLPHSLLGNL